MNETSFTYSGVTVQYTEAQKALILQDQQLIAQLNSQKAALQTQIGVFEAQIAEAKAHLDNECNNYTGSKRQNCINQWNTQWDNARNQENAIVQTDIPAKDAQIASATKKLNDDIATIQNDIKLQIQAQLANTAAATAAATNQSSVATAPQNAAAAAAAQLQELKNQAEAEKLKSERQTKMFTFGIIAVVVIAIGYFAFKRMS